MSDPANAMTAAPADAEQEQKPLVEQVEEERADEDRETFITESGLVEEVEEEDAQVGAGHRGGGTQRMQPGVHRQRRLVRQSQRQEQQQECAPTPSDVSLQTLP